MAIVSKLIGGFTALGRTVDHKGTKMRPEVKVTIASARVTDIQDNRGNLNITMAADGAKFKLGGFISADEQVAKVIELAREKDEPVCVRFEKKRKKDVDPTLPIEDISKTMDLARDNIVRTVVGVYDYNQDKWILSREAQSNPEEDPEGTLDAIRNLNFNVAGFFEEKAAGNVAAGGPVPANYAERNRENAENAIMSMFFFLCEQEEKHGYKVDYDTKRKHAIQLVKVANMLQMQMFDLEEPDYAAYSHTRARYLIFKWAEVVSPLNENASNKFSDWGKALLKNGASLWTWCKDSVDNL